MGERRRPVVHLATTTAPAGTQSPRRVGPAELFAEVAPLLDRGQRGEDAMDRLAFLLQEDPALIDLRLRIDAVEEWMGALAPAGLEALDAAARDLLFARALPALVPPRFGREVAESLARASARRTEPRDRLALALGRYLALLDDVEGAAGAGENPLWRLLFELTHAERRQGDGEGRELLALPGTARSA